MRKLNAALFMSVDGVVETPFKWSQPYVTDEYTESIDAALTAADSVLLGRRTYEIFSGIWPNMADEMPMAHFLNHSHKYVVSTTLEKLGWGPASLIKQNPKAEISKLKHGPGKNIQVPGSPALVRWLVSEGLLDELMVAICPIALGKGQRLFEGSAEPIGLKLIDSKTSATGLLTVRYRKASGGDLGGNGSGTPPQGLTPWAVPSQK